MWFSRLVIIIIITLSILGYAYAQDESPESIMPVSNVSAIDTPNDDGSSITLSWYLSPTDDSVSQYIILRKSRDSTTFEEVGQVTSGKSKYFDENELIRNTEYVYKISAVGEDGDKIDSIESNVVKPVAQWFNMDYKYIGIAVVIFCGIMIYCILSARRGRDFFVRQIAGIEAVDEAIGRATEMGKPILYITGLGGVGGMATLASLNILGRVARISAEYDTPLIVPANDAFVMVVEREIVKGAHSDAGKPDTYREDNIFFVSDEQFAYTAAVNGIMLRERPAAIFFMGSFFAESLILAETGNSTGAIQIAGTDSDSQLPFFIASCDYTLIGEELYAASAYLSKEPLLLGSLKGQDWSKLILMIAVFFGVIAESFALMFDWQWLHWMAKFFGAQ